MEQHKEKDQHYMQEALIEAELALDSGEFPVGCVFVFNHEIIARGRRRNSGAADRNEIDHAEITTLRMLIEKSRDVEMDKVRVYSTMEPCLMCYTTMLLSGIRKIIWAYEDVMGGGTSLPLSQLNPLYADMKVQITGGVLRRESLVLFQRFFKTHSYWKDSLLAQYTLDQTL